MQRLVYVVTLLSLTAFLAGCPKNNSAENVWEEVVKQCLSSKLSKTDQFLYFGPSPGTQPGTAWRQTEVGEYRLRWLASTFGDPSTFVAAGAEVGCDGKTVKASGLKASASFSSLISPVDAEAKFDLGRVKEISVSVKTARLDEIIEGNFVQALSAMNPPNAGVTDLRQSTSSRLIVVRGAYVKGLTATLKFDGSIDASVLAKYSGTGAKKLAGDINANLSGSVKENGTLEISSSDGFYVAGTLGLFSHDDFASSQGGAFAPVQIPPNPKVVVEPTAGGR